MRYDRLLKIQRNVLFRKMKVTNENLFHTSEGKTSVGTLATINVGSKIKVSKTDTKCKFQKRIEAVNRKSVHSMDSKDTLSFY